MRKWLAMLRPNPWLARRVVLLAILVGVAAGAFCWGRHGAVPEVEAQQPASNPNYTVVNTPAQPRAIIRSAPWRISTTTFPSRARSWVSI